MINAFCHAWSEEQMYKVHVSDKLYNITRRVITSL